MKRSALPRLRFRRISLARQALTRGALTRAALVGALAAVLPGCMALGNVSATPTEYYGGTSAAWNAVVGHGIDPYPWFTEVFALPLEPIVDTVLLPVVAYRRNTSAAAAGDPNHEFAD